MLKRAGQKLWLGLVLLALVCAPAAAAKRKKPRKSRKPKSSARLARPRLGPSLDSRALPPHYFPNVVTAWQAGELEHAPLFDLAVLYVAADQAVADQKVLLRYNHDPLLRSVTVGELGAGNNRTAVPILLALLDRARDSALTADIIGALSRLRAQGLEERLAPFVALPDRRVRLAALKLYGLQSQLDPQVVLKAAQAESDPVLRQLSWAALAERPDAASLADWLALLRGDDAELAALAVGPVLNSRSLGDQAKTLAALAAECPALVGVQLARHAGGAGDQELSRALLGALLAHRHAAVRAAAAITVGGLRLQPLAGKLAGLADDADPEVRWQTAKALGAFPAAASFKALAKLLGDDAFRVHRAAIESMAAIADGFAVADALGPYLQDASARRRASACRVLTRLHTPKWNKELLRRVALEEEPLALGPLLEALAAGGAPEARQWSEKHAAHPDVLVRQGVTRALRWLQEPETYPILSGYAIDQDGPEPRDTALASMAEMGDIALSEAITASLTEMSANYIVSGANRSRALSCWSAGRLKDASPELVKRLQRQALQKVIPTQMGPELDMDYIRISACLALVELARRTDDQRLRRAARLVIDGLQEGEGEAASMSLRGVALREYARQVGVYLEGGEVSPGERQYLEYRFSFFAVHD